MSQQLLFLFQHNPTYTCVEFKKIKRMKKINQIGPIPTYTLCIINGPNQIAYYPLVQLVDNFVWQNQINVAIGELARELIDLQVGNMPTTVEEMIGLYEIKNNQRQVLSLSISNYTYHFQAAHGMTYIKSLTFDMKEEKICSLADLFKPDSNYVEVISKLVKEQIEERDIPLLGEFTQIQPNQDFYIADKTLVIYFQLYEISPYVVGFPMFPISVFDLESIINENGPLARMAVNN